MRCGAVRCGGGVERNVCETRAQEIAPDRRCPMHILQQISCRLVNKRSPREPAKTSPTVLCMDMSAQYGPPAAAVLIKMFYDGPGGPCYQFKIFLCGTTPC